MSELAPPKLKEQGVKKIQGIAFWVILMYLWVMMILFGAIVMETFMVYPQHLPRPASVAGTRPGVHVREGSERLFPPLGFFSWGTRAGALSWVGA